MTRRAIAAWLTAGLVGSVAVSGCGGHGSAARHAAPTRAANPNADLLVPRHVPRVGRGAANPAAVRVIRGWLRALARGDVRRAASYFALPSKFQNGTPVLTIDTQLERIAINAALPCGATLVAARGAGAFTIVKVRLIQRPFANCGAGVGGTARTAIRVSAGKIREWYRLPDRATSTGPALPVHATGPAV